MGCYNFFWFHFLVNPAEILRRGKLAAARRMLPVGCLPGGKEDRMYGFQLRPTFILPLLESRQEVIDKLAAEFGRSEKGSGFLMHGEYGELHLPVQVHRLWSPHLSFYVSEQGETSLIHGRFAPRMEVWTFVWVVYLAMSFTAFYGFALAYSQYMLGQSLWGIWVALLSMLAILTLYVVANVGQQWSADQMRTLRERLECILLAAGVRVETSSPVAVIP